MSNKIINIQNIKEELGRSGLTAYSGVIYEETLRSLQSQTLRYKIYREMIDNDATIAAIFFAIDMLIRNVIWSVQAADDSEEAEEIKLFIEECMDDMSNSWEDTVSEILSFLPWGWSFHEVVYKDRNGQANDPSKRSKYNDGKIGWRKLALRAQDTLLNWEFDEEGGINAMVQLAPPDYKQISIPIEKALLFRTNIYKGNPEGKAMLRAVYRSWYFKKKIETYEAIGIERDLAGLPVAYAPYEWTEETATPEQQTAYSDLKKLVTRIKRDEQEGVVLPYVVDDNGNQTLKLELLNAGGKRNFETDKIIQRYDQRIAMSVLADFILLGSRAVGSFALASSKTELFATALGAWTKMIAGVFNRHAIPRLLSLNGMDLELAPSLVPGDIETPDLAELGEYINKLTGAGIDLSNDLEIENHLRSAGGLPLKPEDYEYPEKEEETVEEKESGKKELIEAVTDMKETVKKVLQNE